MNYLILKDEENNIYEIKDVLENKTIFYSIKAFEENFNGVDDRCFICGCTKQEKEFNDEHILSNWILRDFNLHGRKITLPNQTGFTYGRYTIPCCVDCNSEMSKTFETPFSSLFRLSYNDFAKELTDNPKLPQKIFTWLCLIFIKTHLKDTFLDLERNKKLCIPDKISDIYGLEAIHHIHCVARSFYTGASMCQHVMGSMIFLPAIVNGVREPFDYIDLVETKTVLLRINEIAIIAVLNDSCAVLNKLIDFTKGVKSLSPVQLREVFAHYSYASDCLVNTPLFSSRIDSKDGYLIDSKLEGLPNFDFDKSKLGDYLYAACSPIVKGRISEEHLNSLREGRYTFLRDKDGNFSDHSI